MEQHPPLGKLLIAAGEALVDANANDSQFIISDYATGIPDEFSFAGYRFFPTLLGWLTSIVVFFLFLFFTKNPAVSTLLSFLYIFDNAQIVHSRGAMVDSPLTFFGLLTLLLLLHLTRSQKKEWWKLFTLSVLAGISFGAVMTTKLVGLIFILGFIWALHRLRKNGVSTATLFFSSILGFLIVFSSVWYIHFALGSRVEATLSNSGYYESSEKGKAIIDAKQTGSFSAFPVLLRDAFGFVSHYNKGVPVLNLCKEGENGSPSFFWPIGAKTINYRWETPDGNLYRYLYLVSNPVGWALGFMGVLLCSALMLSSWLLPVQVTIKHRSEMMLLLSLYWGYLFAISQLGRVMYLYHYFIPLVISFLLFGLLYENLTRLGPWVLTESRKLILITIVGLSIFLSYQLYRPLSYYVPVSNKWVESRAIVPLWELHCATCDRNSSILNPKN